MTCGRPGSRAGDTSSSGDPRAWEELGWRSQNWTFWPMQPRETRPMLQDPGGQVGGQGPRCPPHSDLLHIAPRKEGPSWPCSRPFHQPDESVGEEKI